MKFFFLILSAIFTFNSTSYAVGTLSQETVTYVETDAFPGTFFFDVLREENGNLHSMVYRTHDGRTVSYTIDQLRGAPQVLKRVDNRDVIFLSLENGFSSERGGYANLRFLYSGITGRYKNFRIFIEAGPRVLLRSEPNLNDPDSDQNSYRSVFNYIYMQRNSFFGKTTGIELVVPEYRPNLTTKR